MNPYRCAFDVRGPSTGRYFEVWMILERPDWSWALEEFLIGFPTEEEARAEMALMIDATRNATEEA